MTIDELERWKCRREQLRSSMKKMSRELKNSRLNELRNIERQIAYYNDLVCQMKRKVSPTTLSGFCRELNK